MISTIEYLWTAKTVLYVIILLIIQKHMCRYGSLNCVSKSTIYLNTKFRNRWTASVSFQLPYDVHVVYTTGSHDAAGAVVKE